MYPDWMKQAKTPRVELLPYKRPSELPVPAWFDEGDWQGYVPAELISGIYRCTRCGMCEKALKHKSIECDVPVEKRTGPVAFRHRIAILRGLIERRITREEVPSHLVELFKECHFCLTCVKYSCICNSAFNNGLASEPNIKHEAVGLSLMAILTQGQYAPEPCQVLKDSGTRGG